MKLKKPRKKRNMIALILFFLILTIILTFNFIGKKITPKITDYASKQANKVAILVITKAVDEKVLNELDSSKLFITEDGETNYNTVLLSELQRDISINVREYLKKLETGEINNLGLDNNIDIKNGVIYEVPSGIIFNNGLLANIGPKIPVKLSMQGEITTDLITDVKEYGINNAVITLSVRIAVNEQVILPYDTNVISVSTDIPLAIKLVKGDVPSYFSLPK